MYRARDTRLHREVALKLLPDAFTADAGRVARFQREAQLLAALNHPNIGGIYGLEQADGTQFLVLELIDGATLAARIAAGPLPVDEALAIARQIAEALEAAHEKGIIHRDLKPAYMAPEQAKGRAADKRCDVWAFGCVFYEMLTGKRAFEGEDVSDTLATVLRGEPDWTALPKNLPDRIRMLIARCLAKDRKHRLADLSVALFLLNEPEPGGSHSAAVERRAQLERRAEDESQVATLKSQLSASGRTLRVEP